MFIVKIKKLTEDCTIPQKAHIDDAAFDIYAAENIIVEPQKPTPVSTGFCMELPPQAEAQIRPRSGLALKHSITVLNTPGTVDAGYRGEAIGVAMDLDHPEYIKLRLEDTGSKLCFREP